MTSNRPKLSVIGTGYLGATHAVCMVELGYDVIGLDVDEAKIESLRNGQIPFYEPGLPELLTKHAESGRLRFTTSFAEVAEFADVHFVCVGTPQRKGELAADMTYVEAAFTSLRPASRPGARSSSASRPCPRERPRAWRSCCCRWRRTRTSNSRGTPSSCARASRSRTP